ncbi:hypothetical protein GGTG_01479 [Gaeumannomyces tritici R3-111a-1]|uniref:Uncharacterized protein n=1 Tax=Gaeumannomyces tritici (strain R3-111a-1) TaxID=644352 RepID=J3NJP9_GAET3|nr:hypothetical protein GGTG_01479 [Gaeumannomyces tritici R3-111a-1]EJT81501.1 hypothetical protein GGTG_01479 [Gaeumannomyces tritici R3-111a-1]
MAVLARGLMIAVLRTCLPSKGRLEAVGRPQSRLACVAPTASPKHFSHSKFRSMITAYIKPLALLHMIWAKTALVGPLPTSRASLFDNFAVRGPGLTLTGVQDSGVTWLVCNK